MSVTRINGKLHYHDRMLRPGPWHDEPDRVEFEHEGFPCLLLRNSAWCGYVGVPPGHPWHGKNYDDVRTADGDWPSVHGGLTYSAACHGRICHVPKPGETDDVWWLGFDCAHSGDLVAFDLYAEPLLPHEKSFYGLSPDTYRNVDYVRRETECLAAQARAARHA